MEHRKLEHRTLEQKTIDIEYQNTRTQKTTK